MTAWVRRTVAAGTLGAAALTAHTAVNLRLLRTPPTDPPPLAERVSLLLPLRDEVHRLAPCVRALLDVLDRCGDRAELVVLDDGSSDGTTDALRQIVGDQPRVRIVAGAPLPPGWLGKPHACAQLADLADPASTVLVFVDADVVLAPDAVGSAVALLRWSGLDVVCPYPGQVAVTAAERLVQPLLQWSILTTLPLRVAERSPRPSLTAANGQFLVADTAAYRRSGGHAGVRSDVLEDIALLRAVKAAGGRGAVVDGTQLATCRMYDGWRGLRDGYGKSLWSAFGSPAGAAGALSLLGLCYVVPPVAAVRGSRTGAAGFAAAVLGRVLVARRTGGRAWPDALTHPLSVLALAVLTVDSFRRRGSLRWKGRAL